jgi:hypothetical protein
VCAPATKHAVAIRLACRNFRRSMRARPDASEARQL